MELLATEHCGCWTFVELQVLDKLMEEQPIESHYIITFGSEGH